MTDSDAARLSFGFDARSGASASAGAGTFAARDILISLARSPGNIAVSTRHDYARKEYRRVHLALEALRLYDERCCCLVEISQIAVLNIGACLSGRYHLT